MPYLHTLFRLNRFSHRHCLEGRGAQKIIGEGVVGVAAPRAGTPISPTNKRRAIGTFGLTGLAQRAEVFSQNARRFRSNLTALPVKSKYISLNLGCAHWPLKPHAGLPMANEMLSIGHRFVTCCNLCAFDARQAGTSDLDSPTPYPAVPIPASR